jgi:hypothetical protein
MMIAQGNHAEGAAALSSQASEFRNGTRLHIFDEPFAVNSNQSVVRISMGGDLISCLVHIETLEV